VHHAPETIARNAVYQLDLDDKWSATEMYALVCGDKVGDVEEDNACSIDNIASPDNVIYMPGHDATLIGALLLLLPHARAHGCSIAQGHGCTVVVPFLALEATCATL
jgi:hypothetical protein